MELLPVKYFGSGGLNDPHLMQFLNTLNQWLKTQESKPMKCLAPTQVGDASHWTPSSNQGPRTPELWILDHLQNIPAQALAPDYVAVVVFQHQPVQSMPQMTAFHQCVDVFVRPNLSLEQWDLLAGDALKKLFESQAGAP